MNIFPRIVYGIIVGLAVFLLCMFIDYMGIKFFGEWARFISVLAGVAAAFFYTENWPWFRR